jgi:hypothetical protein
MKVYATTKILGEVTLLEWASKKAFQDAHGWCDPEFINIATSVDLVNYEFNEPTMIVYSEDQKASKTILHNLYHELKAKLPKQKDVPYFMNIDNA